MALIDEVAVYAEAAISAVRQREGHADMRQIDLVLPLAATGRPFLPGEKAALADSKNAAHQPMYGEPISRGTSYSSQMAWQ